MNPWMTLLPTTIVSTMTEVFPRQTPTPLFSNHSHPLQTHPTTTTPPSTLGSMVHFLTTSLPTSWPDQTTRGHPKYVREILKSIMYERYDHLPQFWWPDPSGNDIEDDEEFACVVPGHCEAFGHILAF